MRTALLIPLGALFAIIGIIVAWFFVPWNFMEDVQLRDGATTAGCGCRPSPCG